MTIEVNKKNKNKELRKVLIERDISIAELAQKVGVGREWLSRIINGHWPGHRVKRQIAEILQVPFRKLWKKNEGT